MSHRANRQAFGPSRFLRRLLITLLVIALLLLGVDFGLRLVARNYLTDQLRASLAVANDPEIEFGGFPFTVQVIRGRLERLDLTANQIISEGGLLIDHMELHAVGLAFDPKEMLTGGTGTFTTKGGDGAVRVSDRALTRYAQSAKFPVTISFGQGVTTVATEIEIEEQAFPVSATGGLSFENNKLTFVPKKLDLGGVDIPLPKEKITEFLRFTVPFQRLFNGIEFTGRTIEPGRLTIEFDLVPDVAIRVQEGRSGGDGGDNETGEGEVQEPEFG